MKRIRCLLVVLVVLLFASVAKADGVGTGIVGACDALSFYDANGPLTLNWMVNEAPRGMERNGGDNRNMICRLVDVVGPPGPPFELAAAPVFFPDHPGAVGFGLSSFTVVEEASAVGMLSGCEANGHACGEYSFDLFGTVTATFVTEGPDQYALVSAIYSLGEIPVNTPEPGVALLVMIGLSCLALFEKRTVLLS